MRTTRVIAALTSRSRTWRQADRRRCRLRRLTDSFAIRIASLFVGLILASPVWLFQIWGFIVPGLTKKEKLIARLPSSSPRCRSSSPGAASRSSWCPRPSPRCSASPLSGAYNLQDGSQYLNFVLKFIIAFGCAFLLPVFLVALNLVGILPARTMLKSWRPAIMIIFVFAAIMTPTPDAYTMIFLASPMIVLYFASVGIAFLLDRRKEETKPDWLDVADDQASAL